MAVTKKVSSHRGCSFYIWWNKSKVYLFGFFDDISDKYITIGVNRNTIDLSNRDVTAKLNQTQKYMEMITT